MSISVSETNRIAHYPVSLQYTIYKGTVTGFPTFVACAWGIFPTTSSGCRLRFNQQPTTLDDNANCNQQSKSRGSLTRLAGVGTETAVANFPVVLLLALICAQ
jgi:hypothetical protein